MDIDFNDELLLGHEDDTKVGTSLCVEVGNMFGTAEGTQLSEDDGIRLGYSVWTY